MSDMSDSNDENANLEEDQLSYRCQQLHQQYLDNGKDSVVEEVIILFKKLHSYKNKITG